VVGAGVVGSLGAGVEGPVEAAGAEGAGAGVDEPESEPPEPPVLPEPPELPPPEAPPPPISTKGPVPSLATDLPGLAKV
jgi:hypothetical protein